MARQRADEPVRITTAPTSRAEDLKVRQRRYLISMGIRSACFVGAGLAGVFGVSWLWPILIVGALFLPYVAVILANVQTTKDDGADLRSSAYVQRQLGGSSGRDAVEGGR
ncbi:DUF3099 domain-containing protein [Nocardioides bruguierae]|uniref:DUF3099 domain-containing protein n=1 Tax=Nocardioides bruguierae TaxID=2945102 RepID=A0A9X2D603_9ACTN|nr:DUF3099 domain-containing protein [Nocardioides bruguierae]MCL8024463.1 DUF3099 domain-containing protein [Nocardioides bruguierae]MCM0618929.1 DUF3099 domain-containing protein [Nocardioides bruguierae]